MAFRILIVDDSAAMRSYIRRVAELSGLDVGEYLEAGDGAEAIAVLQDHWVDAVLTDINMPHMTGEELLRQMIGSDLLREIPVLIVSTDATESRIHNMLSLGARGYLSKPFSPERLRDELVRVLGVNHA